MFLTFNIFCRVTQGDAVKVSLLDTVYRHCWYNIQHDTIILYHIINHINKYICIYIYRYIDMTMDGNRKFHSKNLLETPPHRTR